MVNEINAFSFHLQSRKCDEGCIKDLIYYVRTYAVQNSVGICVAKNTFPVKYPEYYNIVTSGK